MSIIKSIFLGSESSCHLFGINVIFERPGFASSNIEIQGAGFVSYIATRCINNKLFQLATFGYAHVFIHELSHALSYKLLSGHNSDIVIYTDRCEGKHLGGPFFHQMPAWKRSICDAAGSMGNIAFSIALIAAGILLASYVYIAIPIAIILIAGGVFWISGEILYTTLSVINNTGGDFSWIAQRGKKHLICAGALLVGEVALGILLVMTLTYSLVK